MLGPQFLCFVLLCLQLYFLQCAAVFKAKPLAKCLSRAEGSCKSADRALIVRPWQCSAEMLGTGRYTGRLGGAWMPLVREAGHMVTMT